MDIITGIVAIATLICVTIIACVTVRANADASRPPEIRVVQVERMQVNRSLAQSSGFLLPAPLPDVEAIRRRADMMAHLITNHGMSGDQAWQYLRSWAYANGQPELVE